MRHRLEHGERPLLGLTTRNRLVEAERLDNLIAYRDHRIERELRVLQDHGDAPAADAAHGALVGAQEIDAIEGELFRPDGAVASHEAEQGASGLGLAGPRFANDAELLARK